MIIYGVPGASVNHKPPENPMDIAKTLRGGCGNELRMSFAKRKDKKGRELYPPSRKGV